MAENTIGLYQVKSLLAISRWAVIYRCVAPDESDCAIKVFELGDINVEKTPENVETWRRRFLQERWLLREVANPNLVEVQYEGETRDGRPYYVMPLLAGSLIDEIGRDLGRDVDINRLAPRRRPKPLPLPRATSILRQILRGVAALHGHNVVHRDLKPANILMTKRRSGRVRIGDLGMASVQGRALDVAGETFGSRGYRAPELSDGISIDPRLDVFAIGAMAQRMLTGLPIHYDPSPVATQNPNVPDGLAWIVDRARDDDPEKRFQDAGAMLRALEETAGAGHI